MATEGRGYNSSFVPGHLSLPLILWREGGDPPSVRAGLAVRLRRGWQINDHLGASD